MGAAEVEDIELLQWCQAQAKPPDAKLSWMCVLGVPGELVMSNPNVAENRHFLCGRSFGGSCLSGLPVEAECVMGNLFFRLSPLTKLHWLPVVDPGSWSCYTVTWICPKFFRAAVKEWPSHGGFLLHSTSPKRNLLEQAAMHGFWQLPRSGLKTLADELGAVVHNKMSFPDAVVTLATHILGELDDVTKLSILRRRMPKSTDVEGLLATLDVEDVLDKSDGEAFAREAKNKEEIESEFGPVVRSLANEVHKKTSKSQASRSTSSSNSVSKRQRRWPRSCTITENTGIEELNTMVPGGCKFYIDAIDEYWRLYAWNSRYGRSWALHGVAEGAKQLLRLAWQRALSEGHETECPWPDLLE